MKLAGARPLNTALSAAILATAVLLLLVLSVGGVAIRFGDYVPGVGKAKLTCTTARNPFLALLALLLVKAALFRPDPVGRAVSWLKTNRRALALGAIVAVSAGFPRLHRLGAHSLNPDSLLWMDRGQRMIYALREREFKKATMHLGHPGIVPAALVGASCVFLGDGTSALSFNLLDRASAARLPAALAGTLTCLLLYVLGRRSFGDAAAFWGAVLLAFYPPHVAISRVVHIDSTLALLIMPAALSYPASGLRGKAASGALFGLALMTKSPAILLPFALLAWKALVRLRGGRGSIRLFEARDLGWLGIGLGLYLSLFTKLWYDPRGLNWADYASLTPWGGRLVSIVNGAAAWPWLPMLAVSLAVSALARRRAGTRGPLPRPAAAALLLLSCLSFVQVFRLPLVNSIHLAAKVRHIGGLGHIKFWMGRLVTHPPRWFYPFMLGIQSPPAVLILAACGAAAACSAFARMGDRWRQLLLCLVVPSVFIAAMAAGNKMAVRYIAPAFPFLCLLAGEGLVRAAAVLAPAGAGGRRRFALHAAAGTAAAVSCAAPLARVFPYPEIYANVFAGGPAGASRMVSLGPRVGSKEAAAFLKTVARDDDSIFAATIHGELRWHWLNDAPQPAPRALVNRTNPPRVDWIVFPLAERSRPQPESLRALEGKCPKVWSMNLCGVDFVDIYRVDDPPRSSSAVYEAEGLKSEAGAPAPDDDASGGVAIRGRGKGTVILGPWERYAPGNWRAFFRLKERGGASPALRCLVAGISRGDVFGSRRAGAGALPAGGGYIDVPVDFTLREPRRIQFRVEAGGGGEVWIDRVAVEKR